MIGKSPKGGKSKIGKIDGNTLPLYQTKDYDMNRDAPAKENIVSQNKFDKLMEDEEIQIGEAHINPIQTVSVLRYMIPKTKEILQRRKIKDITR